MESLKFKNFKITHTPIKHEIPKILNVMLM